MCWNLYWNDELVGHAVTLPGWIVASPLWKWACQGGSSVIGMQTQVVQILVPKRTFCWLGPPSLHQVLMLSEFCLSIKLETFYFGGKMALRIVLLMPLFSWKQLLLLARLSSLICCALSYVLSLHGGTPDSHWTHAYVSSQLLVRLFFWQRKH